MLPLGILFDLLTFPVSYPIKGVILVAKQLQKQVDEEAFSPENVEHGLLELQMLHEIGEISDEEFQKKETELLDRLDELMLAKGVLQDVEEEKPVETYSSTSQKQEEQVEMPTPRVT